VPDWLTSLPPWLLVTVIWLCVLLLLAMPSTRAGAVRVWRSGTWHKVRAILLLLCVLIISVGVLTLDRN
jgi:hypothetical protein